MASMDKEGEVSTIELEAINLTISQLTACEYCRAARAIVPTHAGFSIEQTFALRRGKFTENSRINVLLPPA